MHRAPIRLILFLILAIAASGCTQSIAEDAGRLPPLDQLSDVRLGMRAYALRRARPNAVAVPYFGFREQVGSIELMYEVPGSMQDGEAPPWWEPLQSVVATERFGTDANVFAVWQAAVRHAAINIGTRPTCYSLGTPGRQGWLALWSRGHADVFVIGQIINDDSRPGSTSNAVATGVARTRRALSRTVFAPRTARECDELLRR